MAVERTGPGGPISTSTPTNITGLLKGNGSTILQASAGTDYASSTHASTHSAGQADAITVSNLAGYIAPPTPSTATPLVESGTGAAGTATPYSREDHVHPAASGGGKALVSSTDTASNYLSDKILEGSGVSIDISSTPGPDLLIRGNGVDGSSTILDISTNAHVITNHGLTISTTQQKAGAGSLHFDGASYATTPSADFNFLSADFTVMWWEYQLDTTANRTVLYVGGSGNPDPLFIGYNSSGNSVCYLSYNQWFDIANAKSMGSIDINAWVHRCITRSGNIFRTFKNGAKVGEWTSALSLCTATTPLYIGSYGTTPGYYPNGYIYDLYIRKGTAVYTADFTPQAPTASSEQLITVSADTTVLATKTDLTGKASSTHASTHSAGQADAITVSNLAGYIAPPTPSTATPLVESGTGSVGTATPYSREDHVHPATSSAPGHMDVAVFNEQTNAPSTLADHFQLYGKTTINPAYGDDVSAPMTGNALPSPNVTTASNESSPAWCAFDKTWSTRWQANGSGVCWIKYDYGSGNTKTLAKYTIKSPVITNADRAPKAWTFEGSDNNTGWTTLDTRTDQTAWGDYEIRTFYFTNVTAYRYYKLNITQNNNNTYTAITDISFHEKLSYAETYTFHIKLPDGTEKTVSWT